MLNKLYLNLIQQIINVKFFYPQKITDFYWEDV